MTTVARQLPRTEQDAYVSLAKDHNAGQRVIHRRARSLGAKWSEVEHAIVGCAREQDETVYLVKP